MTIILVHQFLVLTASGGDFTNHSCSSGANNDNILHSFPLGFFFCRFSLFF